MHKFISITVNLIACVFTNIAAQTLPRMTTTAPSVSAEPPSQNENIPDSRDKRRDSQGSRGKDRQSREMKEIPIRVEVKFNKAPRASVENVDIESSRESIEGADKPGNRPTSAETQRPKFRQSSKEVYRYTEVEQRQTVLEQEPVVAQVFSEARQTAMPIQIVTTVHDEHGVARKGSDDQPLHHYLSPHILHNHHITPLASVCLSLFTHAVEPI